MCARLMMENTKTSVPPCKYGLQCYRKNTAHFEQFSHPTKRKNTDDISGSGLGPDAKHDKPDYELNHAEGNEKSSSSAVCPNLYSFSSVSGISKRYNEHSKSLQNILEMECETLEASAQFNYMVDLLWLMDKYPQSSRGKPLLIVCGDRGVDFGQLQRERTVWENVTVAKARLDIPYGTHHTKMMLLLYKGGMRVVIHTANLVEQDWECKTQGIFCTPLCPAANEKSKISTGFVAGLVSYLKAYKLGELDFWIDKLENHDFSVVKNVHLIGSIPGRHAGVSKCLWGHLRLLSVLNALQNTNNLPKMDFHWPVVAQFSSIGSLGGDPDVWLLGEFLKSLSAGQSKTFGKEPNLRLVYPCVDDVRNSLEGYPAGGSLPYQMDTAKKQPYLRNFLHCWKSDIHGRTEASPHIKSYARLHPENSGLAWFLLTSANLSKAAWGVLEKKATQLMIRSYELGVLFFPDNDTILPIETLPFDVPLTPYRAKDEPWILNKAHLDKPDSKGNVWDPR